MIKSYKIILALSAWLCAYTCAALIETEAMINVYRPTDNCSLLQDIANANANSPAIVDLGGLVFELTQDCVGTLTACGVLNPQTICYVNHVSPAVGPNALPEIFGDISLVNGRIVRSINAVSDFRIAMVQTGLLSLFKVTIENGDADQATVGPDVNGCFLITDSGNGGGIYVNSGAELRLQSSKVGYNAAQSSGGGIFVASLGAELSVQLSLVTNNTAEALPINAATLPTQAVGCPPYVIPTNLKAGGGGIYIATTLAVSSFAHDKQPPLNGILVNLDSSTVSHNTTPGLGGGLNNQGESHVLDSTFSYNLTCVSVPGSGECENGRNPSGAGGGIYNDVSASLLEVTQTTFWANRALEGGAIYNEEGAPANSPPVFPCAGVCLNNNTIANNYAQTGGGGIYNQTGGELHVLVSNLIGANIDFSNEAPDLDNKGTINAPVLPPNPPTSGNIFEGFNFVGDCGLTGAECGLTNDVNKDIVGGSATLGANIDPRLHALENNGGPTETVALYPDSPAVNNGYNNLSLPFDQRGPNFYRTVAQTDIGSFEVQYDSL